MIKISVCRQAAVNADQSAGDERSSVGDEELDELGHLFGVPHASEGMDGILFGHELLGRSVAAVNYAVKDIFYQRRIDRSGADGVDAYVFRGEVEGEAAGNLAQSAFCQAVGEAVGLADLRLVGGVDDYCASACFDNKRDDGFQCVVGAVDVGLDDGVEFFVGYVENRVAAVDSGIGEEGSDRAERIGGCARRNGKGIDVAGICLAETDIPAAELLCETVPSVGVNVDKGDFPSAGPKSLTAASPMPEAPPVINM